MTARLLATLVLALALLGTAPAVLAARSYDNCAGFIDSLPATVSTAGTWCLRKDLSTALTGGAAITLAANDITLDCNDFKLGNLPAGQGSLARGIAAPGAQVNVTVRNCNVRGFLIGVDLFPAEYGGGATSGHLVEDNRFDGVNHTAIRVYGDNSLIRRNRVVRTVGSSDSFYEAEAIGIIANRSVVVRDNTVIGLKAYRAESSRLTGILAGQNSLVTGNFVSLAGEPDGVTHGISASIGSVVRDNEVRHNGQWGYGISCHVSHARRNVVTGFPAFNGLYGCEDDGGNTVVDAP